MIANLMVGIGPIKTGTTWLHRNLRRCGRFRLAAGRMKEVHYFDCLYNEDAVAEGRPSDPREAFLRFQRNYTGRASALKQREKAEGGLPREDKLRLARLEHFLEASMTDAWYEATFASGPKDWCLDITPSYCRIPIRGLQHLHAIAQRVEIVLTLRDPADRMRSFVRHAHRQGWIDLDSASDTEQLGMASDPRFAGGSDYVAVIDKLLEVFLPSQLHVVFFDSIVTQPDQVIAKLLDVAGHTMSRAAEQEAPNPAAQIPVSADVESWAKDRWGHMIRELDKRYAVPETWRARYAL